MDAGREEEKGKFMIHCQDSRLSPALTGDSVGVGTGGIFIGALGE